MVTDNADQFPVELARQAVQQAREELGLERTVGQMQCGMQYLCDMHCREYPDHAGLPPLELFAIVEARLNDDSDPLMVTLLREQLDARLRLADDPAIDPTVTELIRQELEDQLRKRDENAP